MLMGMGSLEVQLGGSGKSSAGRRQAGSLHSIKTGGCVKPRIIHTYSPKVYKIKPEEFLDLVQKLTGRITPDSEELETSITSTRPTIQFFETGAAPAHSERLLTCTEEPVADYNYDPSSVDDVGNTIRYEDSVLASPVSTQLLAALPSPRFVTLNFLPMLSASPSSAFKREAGFTGFSSAAY